MKIVLIGVFWCEYSIALANVLARDNSVYLFLSKQYVETLFPKAKDLEVELHNKKILDPAVSLNWIDNPKGHFFRKVLITRNLVSKIFSLKPNIVHYQSSGFPWIPFAMPWLRSLPLVATVHDAFPHSGDWPPSWVFHMINIIVTQQAHQIIVHGNQQKELLINTYHVKPGKVNVIPFGSLDTYKSNDTKPTPSKKNNILFFGRLVAYKGIEILLKAAPIIAAAVPDVKIIIAGSGE